MAKNLRHSFKNPIHVCYRHSIISDRNSMFDGLIGPVNQLLTCGDAASALYRYGVLTDVFNRGQARKIGEFDVFPGEFPYQIRKFHTSDVAAADLMCARLKHQYFVAIL